MIEQVEKMRRGDNADFIGRGQSRPCRFGPALFRTGQPQFAHDIIIADRLLRERAHSDEKPERSRHIIMAALFNNIRWSKIYCFSL